MKNIKLIIVIAIVVLSVAAAIAGFFVLPETLVMQLSSNGTAGTEFPRWLGILLSFGLSAVSPILYYLTNEKKFIITTAAGVVAMAFIYIVNL